MTTDYTGPIGAVLRRKHYDARNLARSKRYAADPEYRHEVLRIKRERYAEKQRATTPPA